MVISIHGVKAIDKVQHPFTITKTLKKLGIQGMYPSIIKSVCSKLVNNILNVEKLKSFLLKSRTRQGCPLFSFLFNIVLEFLGRTIGQEKEIKWIQK
jgi:hypothetical protein